MLSIFGYDTYTPTAYRAYHKWTEDHGPELKLPELDYTPEEMF